MKTPPSLVATLTLYATPRITENVMLRRAIHLDWGVMVVNVDPLVVIEPVVPIVVQVLPGPGETALL